MPQNFNSYAEQNLSPLSREQLVRMQEFMPSVEDIVRITQKRDITIAEEAEDFLRQLEQQQITEAETAEQTTPPLNSEAAAIADAALKNSFENDTLSLDEPAVTIPDTAESLIDTADEASAAPWLDEEPTVTE